MLQEGTGNIYIKRSDNDVTLHTIDVSNVAFSGTDATIDPPSDLPASTDVYVTIWELEHAGDHAEARIAFNRLLALITFGGLHLGFPKLILKKRGVFKTALYRTGREPCRARCPNPAGPRSPRPSCSTA